MALLLSGDVAPIPFTQLGNPLEGGGPPTQGGGRSPGFRGSSVSNMPTSLDGGTHSTSWGTPRDATKQQQQQQQPFLQPTEEPQDAQVNHDRRQREVRYKELKEVSNEEEIQPRAIPAGGGTIAFTHLGEVAVDMNAAIVLMDLGADTFEENIMQIQKTITNITERYDQLRAHVAKTRYPFTLELNWQGSHFERMLCRFQVELTRPKKEVQAIKGMSKESSQEPLRPRRSTVTSPLFNVVPTSVSQDDYEEALAISKSPSFAILSPRQQLAYLQTNSPVLRSKRSPKAVMKALMLIVKGALLVSSLSSHFSKLRSLFGRKDVSVEEVEAPNDIVMNAELDELKYLRNIIAHYEQHKRVDSNRTPYYAEFFKYYHATEFRSLMNAFDSWSNAYYAQMSQKLTAIREAYRGHVTSYLFRPDAISKALLAISQGKESRYSLAFDDLNTNISGFYKLNSAVVPTMNGNSSVLTIGVLIPLINQQQLYSLYKFRNLPIPIGTPELEMTHELEEQFLVISTDRGRHASLTADALAECSQLAEYRICPSITVMTKKDDCLSSLFRGDRNIAHKQCFYRIRYRSGSSITPLGGSRYLITATQARNLYLSCPNRVASILAPVGQSEILLPSSCTLDDDEVYIVPNSEDSSAEFSETLTFQSEDGDDILSSLTERYPLLKLNTTGLKTILSSISGTHTHYTLDNLLLSRLGRLNQAIHHEVTKSWSLGLVLVGFLATVLSLYICIHLRFLTVVWETGVWLVLTLRGIVLAWWRKEEHREPYYTVSLRRNVSRDRPKRSSSYVSCRSKSPTPNSL